MIIQGDCLIKLKELPDNSVDSIVTDPPYELGFMGKSWDNTGIANDKSMWAECLRVLKPGGHLMAFSGTRTYHRMACAIEDAGFEIRDMIEWVYGSGFPKSLNIGKAVDKLQGNERETVREYETHDIRNNALLGKKGAMTVSETKGTSEWEGWGTALKPSHESICMARKPLSEKTVAENCLKWGTGGINIDESRVGTENHIVHGKEAGNFQPGSGETQKDYHEVSGRFPANLIHDNSEEVRECFPETKATKPHGGDGGKLDTQKMGWGFKRMPCNLSDSGGNASRFFKSIIYTSKTSKSERGQGNNHPTVKPIALMEYLIKMVTPPKGTVLDPFMGSGSTGVACKKNGFEFIGIELEPDYCKIAEARINGYKVKEQQLLV